MDNHQQQTATAWSAQTAVTSGRTVGGYLAATTAGSAAAADGRRGVGKSSKTVGTVQNITDDDRLALDPDGLLRAPAGRPETLTPLGTRFLTPRGRDAVLERFPNVSSVVISSVALLQLAKEWQRATQGSAFKRSAQRSADSILIEPPCTGQLVGYMEVERRPGSATGATSEDTLHICGDVLHVTAAFSAPRLSMVTGGRFAQGSGPAQPSTSVIANQMQQRANYLWERKPTFAGSAERKPSCWLVLCS
ncbi:hypothetical protein F1559_003194 [Cyanidiococcus yangmingshanensis]|uniref:Uncharacterized protein n=1 Tax=Cyanidiococcus yangmingshanensis TaxID=2690220 RepID=A0A7J7IJN2_9RHOD|nr:hypothetical protein F1559_003194 [Cyanidiococcus yangmingshanensis]